MASSTYRLLRNGILNLPRPSPACKPLAEKLLQKDAQNFHSLFRSGFHNHLSHHILAAYDLGAPPALLQKIFDNEAKTQRTIVIEPKDEEIKITDSNWTSHLGDQHAYSRFVKFFEERVSSFGVVKTLEQFIFSPEANGEGRTMLARLMMVHKRIPGAHPFILVGYGLEFGNDALVATCLASAAIHNADAPKLYEPLTATSLAPSSANLSILEILSLVYTSPTLAPPMPYDPNALFTTRISSALSNGRKEAILDMCSRFHVPPAISETKMQEKIEQLVWATVLLLFSTGREERKPRLDFFLMHLVTSSIFLKSYIRVLEDPMHRVLIVKAFLPTMLLYLISRGRPVIQPHLVMQATDKPRPPYGSTPPYTSKGTGLGSPLDNNEYNPWPALIEASLYASDSHVLKTIRTLIFAAREYGDTPSGSVLGAVKREEKPQKSAEESIPGSSNLDGSIFVRAAGMLMDYMGWTTCGQTERDDWDRSALGWDDAWKGGDDRNSI